MHTGWNPLANGQGGSMSGNGDLTRSGLNYVGMQLTLHRSRLTIDERIRSSRKGSAGLNLAININACSTMQSEALEYAIKALDDVESELSSMEIDPFMNYMKGPMRMYYAEVIRGLVKVSKYSIIQRPVSAVLAQANLVPGFLYPLFS
jgi:hypothetical protein